MLRNTPLLALIAFSGSSLFADSSPPNRALIRYEYPAGEITALCDRSLAKAKDSVDRIKRINRFSRLFPSKALLPFEQSFAELSDETSPLVFMASVSKNAELRKEASSCEEKLGQYYPTVTSDKELYEALRLAVVLKASERRLKSETLRSFEKNGMSLDDSKLSTLRELKQKLASLQAKFELNLNNDVSTVHYAGKELEGVTASFLSRLPKNAEGKYRVTTKSTDFIAVMENAKRADTRRRMLHAYLNRGGTENTKLLEEALVLRSEIAHLLGFKTWADQQIDGRMAKSSSKILEFLEGLKAKVIERKNRDLAALLEFKKTFDPTATAIVAEDVAYLDNQLKKKSYSIDSERIAEYFPADSVLRGLFDIYSTLFQVSFLEVKDAPVWAEGVKLYEIHDRTSGRLLAYFYRDTIPREGKYGHAAAFTLTSERSGVTPVSAIVANFTPPTRDRPSLLTHDEVETLFHEFGHVMHQTLSTAPFGSLSGSSVAQDFVEAPSQMLENWVWNKEILKKISSHYQTGAPLPDTQIEKMIAAKNFNQGYFYVRQLLFGLFDMRIHALPYAPKNSIDVTKIYNEMHRELFGYDVVEGAHFPASFGHLMGGYDAGYYGYLWSEVYAQDMFSRFEKEGLLNPETGMAYRNAVLAPGNMEDAIELLRRFLSREPNPDAFYRKLGIN